MPVTYTKHGDTWALRSDQPFPFPNFPVVVSKADGSKKNETAGKLIAQVEGRYPAYIYEIVRQERPAAPTVAQVGDLSGLLALFGKAKQHLKFPAIVIQAEGGLLLRVNVAGAQAKVPGSLNVCDGSGDRDDDGRREWFGRVQTDGTYEPSRAANGRTPSIAAALRELATDPAAAAKRSARLTGNCCFCNKALTDERSTAMGYGKICASHYDLPWGSEKTELTI